MALLTLSQAKAFAGITSTDVTRDSSLAEMIDEAIDAVVSYCRNGNLEETEYTVVLDAPPVTTLVLPHAPVQVADFELYVREDANGNPAAFTADDLWTMYTDYILLTGPDNATESESGIVQSLDGVWGLNRERPVYSLGTKLVPLRGAIKCVYTAGYATPPPRLKMALNLIVRKLYHARKLGVPLVGESLNGYSYSAQQSATADGIVQGDPTVQKLLRSFCRPQIGGYS